MLREERDILKRTQRRTAVSVRSRSRATWPMLLPPLRQRSTTSALYSSLNARRLRPCFSSIWTSLPKLFASSFVSVKPTTVDFCLGHPRQAQSRMSRK